MGRLFAEDGGVRISDRYSESADFVLYHGDCADLLKSMRPDSVDLVVTSPPYNIGKQYEKRSSLESYLAEQRPIISELHRVLAPTGSICWQVGNYVSNGEVFPLDIFYYPIFSALGMRLRNRIIWRFGHGPHASRRPLWGFAWK